MTDDGKAMLDEYNEQLQRVNEALNVTENPEDRDNLLSLKNDLQQLISLTSSSSADTNEIDNEYEMFMAEMEREGAYKGETPSQSTGQAEDFAADIASLEGTKCRAPHCHTWGATIYHNALITSVLPQTEHHGDSLKVKVLFVNPTQKEMLPCPYYLETECRFSDEKCHFSHGEIVSVDQLQAYEEPDFAGLDVGSKVLAKQKDKLWHQGMVRRILKDREKCVVKLEKQKGDVEVDFANLLPIVNEGTGDDDDDEDDDNTTGTDDAMDEEAREDFINMSLLIKPSDDRLGSWEKYTKGIGSKLMEKMGYVIGTGLGRRGEGRVEPVTAVALPAGKSLDHCMELREKSGGDRNLFDVERRLKRLARKQEARNRRSYDREKRKPDGDVFNFLNDKLASTATEPLQLSKSQHRKIVQAESSRNLNIEAFKIEQRVKEIQAEMVTIRQAMQRQSGGLLCKQLQDKYRAKEDELQNFQNKAFNIKHEQSLRDTTKKLTKF